MNFGDAKEQIRQKVDIVDLVGSSISLKRSGRGYVGLCPWHDDSKPSMQVNPERQTWKCWVCDIGGDIFSFVMQREGCDFVQALKMLAERAGISLDEGHKKKIEPGSPDDKNTLYQCCEWAAKQFHEYLLHSEAAEVARSYIEERAITPASVEKFKIGFAADQWTWLIDRARTTPYPIVTRCARARDRHDAITSGRVLHGKPPGAGAVQSSRSSGVPEHSVR